MIARQHCRTILALFMALAFLASGPRGLELGKAGGACDGLAMTDMVDCDQHHASDDAMQPDCASFACAPAQAALAAKDVFFHSAVRMLSSEPMRRDDARLRDLRGPPDIRPPIA
jgi:hypothetical protein